MFFVEDLTGCSIRFNFKSEGFAVLARERFLSVAFIFKLDALV